MYGIALLLNGIDGNHIIESIHEIALITSFSLIVAWVYSHLHRGKDTVIYTIIIMVLTAILILTRLTQFDPSFNLSMMIIVRFVLTAILFAVGVHVLAKQIRQKNMENLPLLYLFAFGYWLTIAYTF